MGDNVGDCAGMAADLFETYAVTAVAVMLLGVLTFAGDADRGGAVPARPRRAWRSSPRSSARSSCARATDNVEGALYKGLIASGVIAAVAVLPGHQVADGRRRSYRGGSDDAPSVGKLYLCALIGIGVTALLFVITDYYTSTRFGPVKKTAAASQTGHATNIIQGLAQGLQATALPALVLVLGILGAWKLAGGGTVGIYGIGVAVMGQLSLTGLIVALDAFGPITDNAGGIAEMAELPEEVRDVTDQLDAVGNTTKAVTKGYAIGSAVLAAVVLFAGFRFELADAGRQRDDAELRHRQPGRCSSGLLLGGLMVCLFAAHVDGGRRPRRRRGRRGGAPPVPREAGDHGGHRAARLRALRRPRDQGRAARDDPPVAAADRA